MLDRNSGAKLRLLSAESPEDPTPSAGKVGSGVRVMERRPVSLLPKHSEQANPAQRAALALQRAEQLLARQKLQEAEVETRIALRYQPEDAEAVALYAWIQAFKVGTPDDLAKILQVLTDALEGNPIDETIRFRRAQILNRLGRTDEAVRECQLIVELNPRHIDAQREIRLWEMRNRSKRAWFGKNAFGTGVSGSSKPPPPGLFGRVFRRA
jgi:tetratricopeptide (TPR) repeat protein